MTIQESLDRLVNILSSVDINDLSEAYPHIAEALEIDTEGVDKTDMNAMVESIKDAVGAVESDDVDAVVEEINNFFSESEELEEAKYSKKKKMKEQEDEEDDSESDDDDEDEDEDEDEEDDVEEAKKTSKKSTKKESHFIEPSDLDVSEDVSAMLNGEELTEEFQEKAKTIFEAAVVNKVNEKVKSIIEEFDDLLEEKTQELEEQYAEKLDEFLNYVVKEWVEENKLAVTSGIRSEMTESFIDSLRTVFDEHYIEVPEEKMNVVEDLQAKVEELETGLNEALDSNAKLNRQLIESNREDVIEESMEGLSEFQKEKLRSLLENVEVDDNDEDLAGFKKKAGIIRENYFPTESNTELNEELDDGGVEGFNEDLDPSVARYATALSRISGKR